MKYYTLVILCCTTLPLMAGTCNSIKDDYRRLTCYDRAGKCMELKESRQRLACYDNNYAEWAEYANVSPMTTVRDNPAPAPVSVPKAAPTAEPIAAQQEEEVATLAAKKTTHPSAADEKATADDRAFPLTKSSATGEESPVMVATIVALTQASYGIDYLTLDNDQVWRESSNTRAIFKVGQTVRIEKGIFGSNVLTIDGDKRRIKVKRVR